MTVTTHTLSLQAAGKDILACKGGSHDDGSAFIDFHGPRYTVHAEWSMDAAPTSADGPEVKISVNGGAAQSLTLTNGALVGPAGPWQPALELESPLSLGLVEDRAEPVPEGVFGTIDGILGGIIGGAFGGAAGAGAGSALGGAIGDYLDEVFKT